mmetsp:Transcript_101921/g.283915  ORF Transcript_101921/g.283915 Transcript_101921/m.283915 type:complete len:198 (+) Transcript_101921:198-791(+)
MDGSSSTVDAGTAPAGDAAAPADYRAPDRVLNEADIASLRSKYKPMAQTEHSAAAAASASRAAPTYPEYRSDGPEYAAAAMASDKADEAEYAVEDLVMCSDCQGMGTRREQYNHMLIDRTCVKCDGDGVVPRRGAKPVDRSASAGAAGAGGPMADAGEAAATHAAATAGADTAASAAPVGAGEAAGAGGAGVPLRTA